MLDHARTEEASTAATAPAASAPAAAPSWSTEALALLGKAAELCARNDLDPDAFMQAAWAACLAAHPGLRERLADLALEARVTDLRARGLVGAA